MCFPSGGENFVALDLIVQHVHSQLEKVRIPNKVSTCLCFADSAQVAVSPSVLVRFSSICGKLFV